MFKYLIDKLVKNEKWNALGKYIEPPIFFEENIGSSYCEYSNLETTIYIDYKYLDDFGMQSYELCHARQYGRLLWLHTALLEISGWYTLLTELEAYRQQLKWYYYTDKSEYQWVIEKLNKKHNTKVWEEHVQRYADYAFADLLR